MITISNLANEKTAVIVTGAPNNYSGWVRSDIARKKGLRVSYFGRLRVSKRYSSLDPAFITQLVKPWARIRWNLQLCVILLNLSFVLLQELQPLITSSSASFDVTILSCVQVPMWGCATYILNFKFMIAVLHGWLIS